MWKIYENTTDFIFQNFLTKAVVEEGRRPSPIFQRGDAVPHLLQKLEEIGKKVLCENIGK